MKSVSTPTANFEPTISLKEHLAALRVSDLAFEEERDRRYTEVGVEREKALKIKETADLAALGLAREIQTYKDEKANELREQINSERGLYATKNDLIASVEKIGETVKPIGEYVTTAQGRGQGISQSWGVIVVVVGFIGAVIGAVIGLMV